MRTFARRPRLLLGLILIVAGLLVSCSDGKVTNKVHVLTWKGEVNPIMARYIDRGISKAERSNAPAVVIRLDTPGGLSDSMREIVQRIEASKVPVIVWVYPAGARAASAGTFITMAANVAAMAPNSNIGAATPVDSSGGDIGGALGQKVTNDAVSQIRGIAELRGRNADWGESAVRDAASVNENQAVSLKVVDFIATDLSDLLRKADGVQTRVGVGTASDSTMTIRTAGLPTYENNRNIFEALLNVIADPNIAFLLLSLGSLALLVELFHPTIVVGIIGAISLVLAFLSLGSLPTNWAGVALILFGFVLLGAEVFVHGFGALGIGGIISVALGGWILMGTSDVGPQVSRWLVIGLAVVAGAFFILVVGTIVRIRRMPYQGSVHKLIGARGEARTKLDPTGWVYLRGERWDATAEDAPIEAGASVLVTEAKGLRLTVKRAPEIATLPGAAPPSPPTPSAADSGAPPAPDKAVPRATG